MTRNTTGTAGTLLLLSLFLLSGERHVSAAEPATPAFTAAIPDFAGLAKEHSEKLAKVNGDHAALELFVKAIGPAVDLQDAASTLAAKALPAKLSKDLLLPELAGTVQRFVASLVVWDVALHAGSAAEGSSDALATLQEAVGTREAWLQERGPFAELSSLKNLGAETGSLSTIAIRLELEASRRAHAEWWQLKNWKDRVRTARGLAKLCGTWQWTVHNHQNHGEQKTTLAFLPMGAHRPGVPMPAETVVLGDSVYLRWEMDGRVQEDSLLFTKEGQRLEGTFVNSLGGWGSITGKKIGPCQP